MATPTVLTDRFFPSHINKSVTLFGLRLRVKEIAYKVTVERSEVRANARESLGHTQGDAKYEGSMTVYLPYWVDLKTRCRTVYKKAPMDMQGDLIISTTDKKAPAQHVLIKINGLADADNASATGPDATEVKITFTVLTIREDGKALIEDSIWDESFA